MRSRVAKVLHPLCGRTMLGWALHAIAAVEPDRVAVVVGHQGDDVAKAIMNEAPEGLPVLTDLDDDNAQGEIYLNGAIDLIEGVSAVRVDPEAAKQVNDRLQLAECEAILRQRINERLLRDGVTMIDPSRVYVDADVSVGTDCLLYPGVHLEGETTIGEGCTVGPDTRVIDSQIGDWCVIRFAQVVGSEVGSGVSIGPYAYLRSGCVIGDGAHLGAHVELKNAVVGRDSKVPHLSYIGDAELGDDVNIGAGTITCNWD